MYERPRKPHESGRMAPKPESERSRLSVVVKADPASRTAQAQP